MATYFWVGGAGTWDSTNATKKNWSLTSGGSGNAGVPTTIDTATFDANSGTGAVSISADSTCLTCNFGGSGITATLNANHIGTFTTFNITAGTFDCSTFNCTVTTLNHTGGTFTCNGGTITISILNSTGAVARTISLNASTLSLTSTTTPMSLSGSNLTFNAGTSQINLISGTTPGILGGGYTFYNVSFTNASATSISISGINTFNNLSFASKTAVGFTNIDFQSDQTINGTLTVPAPTTLGASRYSFQSDVLGTTRTITAGTVSLTDVDFRDITGAGTATWSGTRLGNCGGNTNITFPAAKTVYWNLSGSVSSSADGWATTSSGTPARTNFPLAQDTAIFTDVPGAGLSAFSFSTAYNHGTLDFSTRTIALSVSFYAFGSSIYGNLTIGSGVTLASSVVIFLGRNTTQTITSAGKTFPSTITQQTIGGGVVFADAFVSSSSYTLTNGSLSTNYNITSTTFSSSNSNTRSLSLGAGTWTLTGTGTVWNLATSTGMTLTPGTSKIALTDTSATARTFAGGGLTYNNLEIGGTTGTSTLTFTGSNTFNTISSTKTVAHTILFTAGTTTTVSNWTVTGTAGNIVTIGSVTAATHYLVKSGAGDISIDYMNISWSNAT
jgi:hypothetical protein